jgi:hypothetical protein
LSHIRIWERDDAGERDRSALLRLLQRQERLEELIVSIPSCVFPVISGLIGSGGQRLKYLWLDCGGAGALTALSAEDGRGVAALTSDPLTFLPTLEKLVIHWRWGSRLQLEILFGAVAQGAAPNLRTLGLRYPEELRESLEGLLAEALEARRRVAGCRGLAELEFHPDDWCSADHETFPRQLWAALLPTIERIREEPGDDLPPTASTRCWNLGRPISGT